MSNTLELLPGPTAATPQPVFWATVALNQDAMAQALSDMAAGECIAQPSHATKRTALIRAELALENQRNDSMTFCRDAGGLLFAWHGSSRLAIEDAGNV